MKPKGCPAVMKQVFRRMDARRDRLTAFGPLGLEVAPPRRRSSGAGDQHAVLTWANGSIEVSGEIVENE